MAESRRTTSSPAGPARGSKEPPQKPSEIGYQT